MKCALIILFFLLMSATSFAAEKSPEEKLTRRKCSACHTVPRPGKYTEEELLSAWDDHVKKLRKLTEEEKNAILTYLAP